MNKDVTDPAVTALLFKQNPTNVVSHGRGLHYESVGMKRPPDALLTEGQRNKIRAIEGLDQLQHGLGIIHNEAFLDNWNDKIL
jgi:hypothetical protein